MKLILFSRCLIAAHLGSNSHKQPRSKKSKCFPQHCTVAVLRRHLQSRPHSFPPRTWKCSRQTSRWQVTRAAQPGASGFYWIIMGVCRGRTRSPTYGWERFKANARRSTFLLNSCYANVSCMMCLLPTRLSSGTKLRWV